MEVQSREQIKDRMIRLAAEHWNLEENEIEANFDPLAVLLFDAVAGEIESLGYRIKDIQGNLLNELASLMLPQSLLKAKPASCILTARPAEESCLLKSEDNFSTLAKISKPDEPGKEVELNFTPIGTTKLIKASLGYMRAGNKVFKYQDDGRKNLLHQGEAVSLVQQIHFTLCNKTPVGSLAGLQLFFDLKGHSEAANFYFALQDATLLINGQKTTLHNGFYNNAQYEASIKDAFTNNTDYSRKIQREVAGIYSSQFFTIDEGAAPLAEGGDLHAITQDLPAPLVQEIKANNAVLCTIILRRPFNAEIMERLQMAINAFPVINRRLEKIFYKTEKWVNIIPLQVNGTYLDIHSIEGVNGLKYRLQASNYDSAVEEGQAIIRAARVSKNSSNDIRNALKSLLEAIRDESAYFSRTSNDFISSRLNEISKILTRLEDQVELSKDEKPTFRYALLKAKNPGETVQVMYWNTFPAEAGFVKANASFKAIKHSLIESGSGYSVTPALGGMDIHNDYAQKQMLVRQLSSKGKIISVEDVKLLCYERFGQQLKKIDVLKSMKILKGRNSGIAKFIDIQITVHKGSYTEDEKAHLQKQLSYELETNASFMFPFEISIVEAM